MNEIPTILFVDDDKLLLHLIIKKLPKKFNIICAHNIDQSINILENTKVDFAVIDLNLSNTSSFDGLDIVKLCTSKNIKSVVLTSDDDLEVIKRGYKLGCLSFFTKWNISENFNQTVLPIILLCCENEQIKLKESLFKLYPTDHKELRDSILQIVNRPFSTEDHILLTGNTGVGKSYLAEVIHKLTSSEKPFICLNLSEYPEQMIESILFGHRKGSFTGATEDKKGLLEEVHGGTLFLDEIGTLTISLQKKLLRILEDKSFYPIGSNKIIKTSFRLITATCDKLQSLIKEGKFRSDFYYRINREQIKIADLKERRNDIRLLTSFFLKNEKINKKIFIEESAIEKIINNNWPGNTRELKNYLLGLIKNTNGYIQADDIILSKQILDEIITDKMFDHINSVGLNRFIQQIENETFNRTWNLSGQKVNKTISQLKISKSMFYRLKESSNEK